MLTMHNAMVSALEDTEIIVYYPTSNKYVVYIFDIETRSSRAIDVRGMRGSWIKDKVPVGVTCSPDPITGNLSFSISCLGDTVNAGVALKNVIGTNEKEKICGWGAAIYVKACQDKGLDPAKFCKEAYKKYWEENERVPVEDSIKMHYYVDSVVTEDFFREASQALEYREMLFREDLLNKLYNGSKFGLVQTIDDGNEFFFIDEMTPDNFLDVYCVNKALFEEAKKVLPYYGYAYQDGGSRIYAAIKGEEPVLIKEINTWPEQPCAMAVEAASILYEVGMVNKEIEEALREYANSTEAKKYNEGIVMSLEIVFPGSSICRLSSVEKYMDCERAVKALRREQEHGRIDLNNNCFCGEARRQELKRTTMYKF